jgi:hypothetical protein
MGIEPTRAPLPELENTGFRVMPTLKCDGGVNSRGKWGNVGMRWPLFGRDFASRPVDAPCGGKRLIVCPPQAQRVVTFVLEVRDAGRVALVHDSSSRPQLRPVEGCPSKRLLRVSRVSLTCPTHKRLNQEHGRFVASRDHVEVWRRMVTEVHLDSTAIESPCRRHGLL